MQIIYGLFLALIFTRCYHTRKQEEAIVSARNIELRDSIFRAQHFDASYIYSKPVCLLYDENPLLKIGQKISQLPTEFSYRPDFNLEFQEQSGVITDYLSLSEFFTLIQPTGSINGIVFFAADERDNRIFYLNVNWLFDMDTSRVNTIAALDSLRKRVLPCLPSSKTLLKNRSLKIDNGDFTECYELSTPKEAEADSSAFHNYKLHYRVSLNPK